MKTEKLTLPKRSVPKTVLYFVAWIGFFIILGWAYKGSDLRFFELITNSKNILTITSGFIPPDFYDWQTYLQEMFATIQIAIWGTFLAIIFSVPLGLLSSKNIAPVWVLQITRRLMDFFRAVNEMIFALIFIAAIGLGPFAGVLALFVHTLGTLAKLFSEAVEAIDHQPIEGIRATGAGPLEEIIYGVIPQVMPLWISYSLYRFEANVRSATVIGMVGAGGIGLILWDAIRSFEYPRASAMLIVIIITVTSLDLISARIRKIFI